MGRLLPEPAPVLHVFPLEPLEKRCGGGGLRGMGGDHRAGVAGRLRTVTPHPEARQLGSQGLALREGSHGGEDTPGWDVDERVPMAGG
jgi:hypothetical protein